jgi:hypothetical protein
MTSLGSEVLLVLREGRGVVYVRGILILNEIWGQDFGRHFAWL